LRTAVLSVIQYIPSACVNTSRLPASTSENQLVLILFFPLGA
jgi:hypothetical protein